MPNLTDLSTIRGDACAVHDFALSKGFGQNFIDHLHSLLHCGSRWHWPLVGLRWKSSGIGVLTEQLCKRADKVVSIEVDKRLPPILAGNNGRVREL